MFPRTSRSPLRTRPLCRLSRASSEKINEAPSLIRGEAKENVRPDKRSREHVRTDERDQGLRKRMKF